MEITPLNQLLERLRSLEDYETNPAAIVAYKLSIAATESLLEDEKRFINRIKNLATPPPVVPVDKTKYKGYLHNGK